MIDWGPDGIYFAAFLKGNAHVFRVNPETLAIRANQLTRCVLRSRRILHAGPSHVRGSRRGARIIFRKFSFRRPRISRRTTSRNVGDQWKQFRLTTREVIEWKSTDGTPIQGVLMKPPITIHRANTRCWW